jgi:hypothetical protein
MKRLSIVVASMLVLSAGSVWAQDVPKFEVFGGGSVLNISDNDFKVTPFGWTASVNGNVNKTFGIVGEIGGNYETVQGEKLKIHNFLAGGQFTHRVAKASVFGQAKAGFMHFAGGGDSDNNFQLGFTGGVDWNASPKVAIRLFQFDWLPTRAQSGTSGHEWVKNVTRGSIGIVFKSASK